MKKILVVFTGGTIGSKIHNSTIDVDANGGFFLIEKLQEQSDYDVIFDTIQPMNILSENSTQDNWKILYDSLKMVDMSKYSGIIVTHGSDTLSYTSAVLGLLFNYTTIPIIITGSNYTLESKNSNGMINFRSSVDFIVNSAIPGVFAIYQDDKGKNTVYLATRIMEADAYNDLYSGFGGVEFGEMKDGIFIPLRSNINPELYIPDLNNLEQNNLKLNNPELSKQEERYKKPLFDHIDFQNEILAIRPYPGLNYEYINLKNKPSAILHSLYHSATGCTGDSDYSLCKFARKCKQEGIDLYLISFKDINNDLYQSSREILENGGIPLQNISFEAAYAKLCIAYNQTALPPREYIEKELFFEFLPR